MVVNYTPLWVESFRSPSISMLPGERDLTASLGVTRPTLRESQQRLPTMAGWRFAGTLTEWDWRLQHELTLLTGNPVFTLIYNSFAEMYQTLGVAYFAAPGNREEASPRSGARAISLVWGTIGASLSAGSRPMPPENLLAIDSGTQSVRALLFDPRGRVVAKARIPIEPYTSPAPGLAEQDPQVYWNALCQACQQLWQVDGVDRASIAAVALTTQRSTMINVDRAGQPLRPAIVWLDQRRTGGLPPVGGLWGAAFKLAGASDTVAYLQAEAEWNWIRVHQPEVAENTHKYLFLSGYLIHHLVGRFVDSVGSQVGYTALGLEVAGRPDQSGSARRSRAAGRAVGGDHARGNGGYRDPRRAAADRSSSRQSLRGARVRVPGVALRMPELRHHCDDQHHAPAVYRGHPVDPALSRSGAGGL